jgi:pepF/M3 family oligoendopeptidase
MKHNALPRWDLASLYPAIDTAEYQNAIGAYTALLNEADSILEAAETLSAKKDGGESRGGFDFPLWLSRYLELENRLGAAEESLNAYAYLIYSTDTTNTAYLNNISRLEELGLRSKAQDVLFTRILSCYAQQLEEFYERFPRFAAYKYALSQTLIFGYHLMSPSEENLANELERTGAAAWDRLHEQIISNLQDPATGKMFNAIRNEAYSADREARKTAWQTEITLLKSMEIPIAAALNSIKGATCALNKRRGWDEALQKSLHSSRVSAKTLYALISAIEDSLPSWREYLKTKGTLVGKKNEGAAFYDLFAPLTEISPNKSAAQSLVSKTWSFDEAKEYIVERFSSFSSEMGDFARRAFALGWIDAEIRRGKVGGAYCSDFPLQKESRILVNFSGAISDIATLAHELGHAFHFWQIKDSDYALQHYPMTLAETASEFAELIVIEDIISRATGFEKYSLIEIHLQDACQVLVDILSRYYFEQSVFEARKTNELSAVDFCRLMKDAQERSYGEGLSGERHEYMWAVKSHYYSPHLDFYNFPYAFGKLFAAALHSRYLAESDFAATYSAILKQTGSASCETVCSKAGFNIETKEFWESGINRFKKEINQFASWANEKAAV